MIISLLQEFPLKGTLHLAMGDRKGGEQETENCPVDNFPCERPASGWPGWLRLQGGLHAQIYCKQSSMKLQPARTSCVRALAGKTVALFSLSGSPRCAGFNREAIPSGNRCLYCIHQGFAILRDPAKVALSQRRKTTGLKP